MFLVAVACPWDPNDIGEEFGGKDHTTVMYSCDKIAQLREKDATLAQTLRQLSDRINLTSRTQNQP